MLPIRLAATRALIHDNLRLLVPINTLERWMKPARLGLITSESRSLFFFFFFARGCLFHAPQKNGDKTGARKNGPPGWAVFTGRGDPGLFADFFFAFFTFSIFVFVFLEKTAFL